MSSIVSARDRAKNAPRSKDLPWFQSNIGSSLTSEGRQLLEEYSGIAPSDVEAHVYQVRDVAWEIFPWPCVGEFWFIKLGLARHPYYSNLLDRLRSQAPAIRFLDLGTCLGQDLRKLVADGASVDTVYGADLFSEYEAIGHQLFQDRDRFEDRFFTADIFDDSADGLAVRSQGTWDIVNINMFLHIWDLNTQKAASKRIIKLLRPDPGSMIIGNQTGSTQPGELVLRPPYVTEGGERSIYRHSLETLVDMWKAVGDDEGVKLDVKIDYDDQEPREKLTKEDQSDEREFYFGPGPEQRKLFFTIKLL